MSGNGADYPLLVLLRSLPGGYSLAYVPHGPDVPEFAVSSTGGGTGPEWGSAALLLETLAAELKPHLPRRCVFLRIDPPGPFFSSPPVPGVRRDTGLLRKAVEDIQPRSTVIVDLRADPDTLLSRMKSKTRYNIRLASKKGVNVAESSPGGDGVPEDFDRWYDLYVETAERDRIAVHSGEYYRRQFLIAEELRGAGAEKSAELNGTAPRLALVLAFHEKELLAGNIVSAFGARGTYLYGASSNRKRNLMPTYALQWAGMEWARERGCVEYDLFGIPPAEDPKHPMHGLYRFKTGFGGRIIHRPGCWDYPLKRGAYTLFRRAETMRKYYFKQFKKR
ncbi:MAG: lipid II:glycine glycyltransferase FemX [bacterium]